MAECLRGVGNFEQTEAWVRKALRTATPGAPLRDLWWTLALVDLHLPPGEAIARLGDPPGAGREDGLEDLRCALGRIAKDGAIRIDCGGEDDVTLEGIAWGADRFFTSGIRDRHTPDPRAGRSAVRDMSLIHDTWRTFHGKDVLPSGYHIPLPPGRYRVALHLVHGREDPPSIPHITLDLVVNGKVILEGFDLTQLQLKGGSIHAKKFEVDIPEGFLDLHLRTRWGVPKISAIEIERME